MCDTVELLRSAGPRGRDVGDISTLARALAGELQGCRSERSSPTSTAHAAGGVPFSCARDRRAPDGRALWRAADPLLRRGLDLGRRLAQRTPGGWACPGLERVHGAISQALDRRCDVPSRVPARWPAENPPAIGPLTREPAGARHLAPARRPAACRDRAVDPQGPGHTSCAPALRPGCIRRVRCSRLNRAECRDECRACAA